LSERTNCNRASPEVALPDKPFGSCYLSRREL
jgi:hypothetical protein